jgi:ATP-binding cassette subfamily B protein
MLLLAVLSLIFGVVAGRFAASATAGFGANLRRDLYEKVQGFSFENIDKFSTSSLVTRLTTDVANVQNALQMLLIVAVRAPFMMLFALILAIGVSPRLSLIFLCAIPIMGGLVAVMVKFAYPLFEKVAKTYDKLNRVVQENLRGIRVVKSYVREGDEIEKFTGVSRDIHRLASAAEKIVSMSMPLFQFFLFGCALLISWLGAPMVISGSLTTGELLIISSYSFMILMGLMMFSMVLVMLTISRASAKRICEVLGEKTTLKNREAPVTALADGSVVFEDVCFSYSPDSEKPALSGVNLKIKSGQTVGVIGGTGSAKSTLVQLIPRLYDVTGGRVLISGVDVRDYDLFTLRNSVAMVLQKNELFSGSVKDNLRWGNKEATDEEIERVCQIACADEFIKGFPDDYDTIIEQGGSNVSGGQKQRLCIARALLKNPKILILDDSTSAVDTKTDAKIRGAFLEDIPDITKIIIAQRVASVEHADQIIVLDDGRVNAVGTHESLLEENDIYREVYTSQTKGADGDGAA